MPTDPALPALHTQRREFAARVLIVVGILLLAAFLALLVTKGIQVLLLLFLATLLGVSLGGAADWGAQRTKLSRTWALVVLILALALLAGALGWLTVPRILTEIDRVQEKIPQWTQQLEDNLARLAWGDRLLQGLSEAGRKLFSTETLQRFVGVFSSTLGVLGSVLLLAVLTLFIAADPGLYKRGLLLLLPPSGRRRGDQVLGQLAHTMRAWLLGRLVDMAILTVITWLGLTLLGVPVPLTLALLAGLLSFIPNIGPILSAIPAIAAGLLNGLATALYVALLYGAIQLVESYLLIPFIQKKAVQLPPVLLLSAQVLLGVLWGVLGLLIATPLTAVLLVLVQSLYRENILREHPQG